MRFLVNADEESITLGILFVRAFSASVTVLESAETAGRGDTALGEFRTAGIHADLIQHPSDWLQAIRVTTRAHHYDLVVVGQTWRRGVTGLLFGTVPRTLLADLHTNLLLARQERTRIRRILIAVGAGPSWQQVLRWGGLAAKAFDAQPVLLHVTERAPKMFAGLAGVDESLSQFMRSNTVEARAFQIAAQSLRLISIEPELKLAHGAVADELLFEARTGEYDLIVLGSSYAAPPSARLLMENVTEPVAQHAPCPVLIVRQADEKRADE
jgi:nucleotide-binding universal stress UspA family protein